MQFPEETDTTTATHPDLENDPQHPLRSFFNLRQAHANTSYTIGIYSAAYRIILIAHDSGGSAETPIETQHHTGNAIQQLTQRAQEQPDAAAIYRSLRFGTNIRFADIMNVFMLIALVTTTGALLQPQLFPQAEFPLLSVMGGAAAATIAFISARRWRNLRDAATSAEDFIAQRVPRIANTPYHYSHRITDQHRIIIMNLPPSEQAPSPGSTPTCAL